MKSLKLTLLPILIACLTFSCNKDDSPTKIDSKSIIGTWKWTASSKNGKAVTLTACNLLDTFIFTDKQVTHISHTEGTTTVCKSDTSIIVYSITDNIITQVGQSGTIIGEIIVLDDNTLEIKSEKTEGDETHEYLDTYTKQ